MPERAFVRRVKVIVPVLSVAIMLAFALIAYTFISSHNQACQSRGKILDAVRDIVVLATMPDPGTPRSAAENRRVLAFRIAVITRLNSARC